MAQIRLTIRQFSAVFTALALALCVAACANTPPVAPRSAADIPMTAPTRPQDAFVKENIRELKAHASTAPLTTPDYQPVSDDITPAKTRLVNIQARNSALGDILHVIADAAGLNLVINDGVQQDRAITITLKRVTADDALSTILNSADYFYSIKDNILSVEATGTKLFELGHPALVQAFNIDVGGDILGSASGLTASGSGSSGSSSSGSGSGSSGSGGSSNMKGTITQSIKADSKAFDFWEGLEKSLLLLINRQEATTAAAPAAAGAPASVTAANRTNAPHQNVVVNRLTGTIMVSATRKNLMAVEKYLDTIKAALNRQVLVEARIIEVQLNDSLKFGIDWSFLSNINNFGMIGGGFGALGGTSLSATLDSKAPSFRIGAITSGSKGTISGVLDALKKQGEVKTLSNPRINVMNGQTALLSVGRNENFVAKVTSTTSTGSTPITTFTVDTGNVLSGMMLGLAPTINSRGEISMTVTPIISQLVKLDPVKIGAGTANETTIQVPTVDLRELSTTIKVRNGEMIVIGGLISNKNSMQDDKIPFLGDIPWLGTLFSRKDYSDTRTELVVVLQPYLVGSN